MYKHYFLVEFLSSFLNIFRIEPSLGFKLKTGEKLNFDQKIILQLNTFFKSIISRSRIIKDQEIFSSKLQQKRDFNRGKIMFFVTLKV